MQDPDFITLFVAPLEAAGIIEQQNLDHELLDAAVKKLQLETEWKAALDLVSR